MRNKKNSKVASVDVSRKVRWEDVKKSMIVLIFLSPALGFAQGLKKQNLNGQQIGSGLNFTQLEGKSPEELQKLFQDSSQGRSPASDQQMQELMEQLKQLNSEIKERDSVLKQLMQEP